MDRIQIVRFDGFQIPRRDNKVPTAYRGHDYGWVIINNMEDIKDKE